MELYGPTKIYDSHNSYHFECNRISYIQGVAKGKHVLHVGCSDFPITSQRIKDNTLLHANLQSSCSSLVGIDLSEQGIDTLKDHGFENVFSMDAENIQLTDHFDLIIAGDVLEHLNNPGLFLNRAKDLLRKDGEIIIGVPSALTFNNIKAWLFGSEQVHLDHTSYYSPKTLSTLCSRFSLLPTKLVFTVQPQNSFESTLFIQLRNKFLKTFTTMSPSFIMHFIKSEDLANNVYWEWR